MTHLQQVHVRVNDAATGKPTPCRVRFTDAAGTYYAPFGRLTEFSTAYGVDVGGNVLVDGKKFAYIDGACEIALPPGKVFIEVHKGPEYTPLHIEHQLAAGKLSLRLTLERWINMREQGWYSGDSRCHFLTPHAALLEAQAEDLAVVNLLAMECQTPETDEAGETVTGQKWAIPNILAFSGQQPALEVPGHMVVVNTLNWHPWLGRLALLNSHRVVYPLRFGAPGFDDWTLSDWCDQCHRKGGLVVWTDGSWDTGEDLADAILGKFDALEIDNTNWGEFAYTHPAAWLDDCGIHLSRIGGSGKPSNAIALGSVRTYACLQPGEQLTYQTWIEALRAERTFVTKGPLLRMTVNDQGPGSSVDVSAQNPRVRVRVEAQSPTPFARIEVHYPGGKIISQAAGLPATALIEEEIQLTVSGKIMARCCPMNDEYAELAFTSPVHVRLNGQPRKASGQSTAFIQNQLHRAKNRVQRDGRFANDAQRQRLLAVLDAAIQRLGQYSPLT